LRVCQYYKLKEKKKKRKTIFKIKEKKKKKKRKLICQVMTTSLLSTPLAHQV